MDSRLPFAELGKPDLAIAGLRLWIHGRQFPESTDVDDGNWLRVTADCSAEGARVWTNGALLLTSDIARFAFQCEGLHRGGCATAELDPLEPELAVRLQQAAESGRIGVEVSLTPSLLTQQHLMKFEIDRDSLPEILKMCASVLEAYPMRRSSDESV